MAVRLQVPSPSAPYSVSKVAPYLTFRLLLGFAWIETSLNLGQLALLST
jgi:hypothetical protein